MTIELIRRTKNLHEIICAARRTRGADPMTQANINQTERRNNLKTTRPIMQNAGVYPSTHTVEKGNACGRCTDLLAARLHSSKSCYVFLFLSFEFIYADYARAVFLAREMVYSEHLYSSGRRTSEYPSISQRAGVVKV